MPVEEARPEPWAHRYRSYALILALTGAFVSGVVREVDARIELPAFLALASAVVLWCQLDALLHGKIYQRACAWLMMFTWPVGVLVHLIWTRRWRGLPLYLGLALLHLAAVSIGAGVGSTVVRARPGSLNTLRSGVPADLD